AHKAREEDALKALRHECADEGVSLLRTPEGFVFAPARDGETMSPEDFEALPEAERKAIEEKVGDWSDRLADLLEEFPGWRKALREAICRAERDALAPTFAHLSRDLRERYRDIDAVQSFLDAVQRDLLDSGIEWGSGFDDE